MEFPDVSNLTSMPVAESSWMEYKESLPYCPSAYEKMDKTICGMLNGGGGYMVFGVRDSDLACVGVPTIGKKYDRFLLRVDQITHNSIITQETGTPLTPGSIVATVVNSAHVPLVVITVNPLAEYGTRFTCRGKVWQRLNASNYLERKQTPQLPSRPPVVETEKEALSLSLAFITAERNHLLKQHSAAKTEKESLSATVESITAEKESLSASVNALKEEKWLSDVENQSMWKYIKQLEAKKVAEEKSGLISTIVSFLCCC